MNTLADIFAPLVWPLCFLLVALVLLWQIREQLSPVINGVVGGLAKNAQSNALTYGLAIGYGLSAALQALAEQATALQWVYVAAAAKVMNPFIVAMLAFAAKNNLGDKQPTPTAPPFPPKPSP